MKKRIIISSLLILLIISFSCKSDKKELFYVDGISTVLLTNKSEKSVRIKIENWYQFPWKSQIIDTLITSGEITELAIITQGKNYYKIDIDDENLKVFAKPNSQVNLTILEDSSIQFSGTLNDICLLYTSPSPRD